MFYCITGKLIHKEPNLAVVECGGVGYKCLTTNSTLARLDFTEVTLYTYLHVTENALDLFGFQDLSELNCFKMLISVSGVGPKAALSILSGMTPERFALTVASGDAKLLTKSQGIGPKIAQRIVLELKDKVSKGDVQRGVAGGAGFDMGDANTAIGEAISALVVLGYAQGDAMSALSGCDETLGVEELIKLGLKKLAMS